MAHPFDIQAEHAKCQSLRQIELDWLRQRAVPRGALIKTALGHWSMLARDQVVYSSYRFEFAIEAHGGESVGAFVIPGLDEFGDLVDLVAWRPPSTVATWAGRVGLLGEELISAARFGEPLHVHETVLGWLKAGREGVVVVDPIRAAPLLRQGGPLGVDTLAHKRRLEVMLTLEAPRIEVVNHDNIMIDKGTHPKTRDETLYIIQGLGRRSDLVDNVHEVAL